MAAPADERSADMRDSKKYVLLMALIVPLILAAAALLHAAQKARGMSGSEAAVIKLPKPRYSGATSVEEALFRRRSVRDYRDGPLTLEEVSQLLWAAQGVTGPRGLRTAPSAGALYPLELYAVVGYVDHLPAGIYKYNSHRHELSRIAIGDKRIDLADAALRQPSVRTAPVVLVFSAVYGRTTVKYGERGVRYAQMEAGHAAQNVCLQAVSLNLGTVVIGAFSDDEVKRIVRMSADERPLCMMPVGMRK